MNFSISLPVLDLIKEYEALTKARPARQKPAPGLDRAAWQAYAELGLLRLHEHPALETHDRGLQTMATIFHTLGRAGTDRGLLFALGAHLFGCQLPIHQYSAPSPGCDALLEGLLSGHLIGALAVTDPQGGSHQGCMKAQASPQHDHFILSGRKTLVSNAPEADLFLVIASTRPEQGSMGWTAFLLQRDMPGLSIETLTPAGLPGAPMGEVILDNCIVPKENILGTREGGLRIFMHAMLRERVGILAGFLGAAQRDLDTCIEYVNNRRTPDGPLSSYQTLSHRIAMAKIRLERAELMIFRAAWAVDTKQRNMHQIVAMAKYEAGEAVVETAMDIFRITAGAGWLDQLGAATALRDSLGTLFASGTPEIQLNTIASSLGLKRR